MRYGLEKIGEKGAAAIGAGECALYGARRHA